MDPLNILIGINLLVSISANFSGAKKGLKSTVTKYKVKPITYLQSVPPNIAAITLIISILAIFNIFTLEQSLLENYKIERIVLAIIFIVFSWTQVFAFKYLKENYTQDIAIKKNHNLITDGPYKLIRHPQYVSQLLSDLSIVLALGSYVGIPLVLLVEIPLFILRAKKEEELLELHFKEEFLDYKKKSGFFIPFVG